jgi:hypothetical protein
VASGVAYAAAAFSIATLIYQYRYLRVTLPVIGVSLTEYLATYLVPLMTTAVAIAIYRFVTPALAFNPWLQIIFAAALSVAAIIISAWWQRGHLRNGIAQWNAAKLA